MTSQNYFLIEDFNPNLTYGKGIYIPLNPFPFFQLERLGVAYKIPEHFYSEEDLRKNEPDFFLDELSWIDSWDTFLKQRVRFIAQHHLRLARMYYNRIKFFINALIIQSHILDRIIRTIGSTGQVVYIKRNTRERVFKSMHAFKYDESSLCFQFILPAVCAKHNVPYRFELFDDEQPDSVLKKTAANATSNKLLLKTAKNAYHFFTLEKWRKWMTRTHETQKANVFFVHSGSEFLDPVIRNLVNIGANVFTRIDHEIILSSSLAETAVFNLDSVADEENRIIAEDCHAAAQDLESTKEGKDLLSWVNKKCEIDVSSFITPYLKTFVSETCPELLASGRRYAKFYAEHSIDFVFSHANADHPSKSALLGAEIYGKTKTACLQHCCDPFIDRVMHLTEIDAFDYYFTTDDMSEHKFRDYSQASYVSPCKVYQSPHYLKLVRSRAYNSQRKPRGYKRILYVPTKLSAVHTRYFNCMSYPILWYLEFQKDLFTFFSQRSEIEFIYKQPMIRTSFIKQSVIPYLQDKRYSNIKIETKPVMDCFKYVDAVIMDRPTTAFFESLMSGLPTLALYPDFVKNMYDPKSFRLFGKSFQSFKNSSEAKEKIEVFLKDSPSDYQPRLTLTDHDVYSILLSEIKTSPSQTRETRCHVQA